MAQFIVRNLEEDIKASLKRRAVRHGSSLEEEVRSILRSAVKDEGKAKLRLGSRIQARFAPLGLTGDLPELSGQTPRPASFKP